MRILQVPPHLSKGGAERVVVEGSNSLIDLGHDFSCDQVEILSLGAHNY